MIDIDFKHKEITDAVLCCFYNVYNRLGHGFLEKVYENSLLFELEETKFHAVAQKPVTVIYRGKPVGEYFADILVENKVIIEVKAIRNLLPEHESQLLNYLRATNLEVGLLLNFGPEPQVRRKVFENRRI